MQKIFIKRQLAFFINLLKIWRLKTTAKRGDVLLMYHRICNPETETSYVEPGMFVTPGTFEMHLKFLKKYFSLIPLENVLEPVSSEKRNGARCVLTFDDAWRDFYFNAFPLLKKYHVPATLFAPTAFIGSDRWFWTDRLARLISKVYLNKKRWADTTLKTPLSRDVFYSKEPMQRTIGEAISQLKPKRQEVIENVLKGFVSDFGLTDDFNDRAFLDWNEIKSLSHSNLVTIGSHTHQHLILTNYSDDEIYLELEVSKQKLLEQQVVRTDFFPFCYPNGNYNSRIARMVAEVGYDLAVTTKPGWNPYNADRFVLKRVALHEYISNTTGMLGCRIAGIF